MTYEQLLQKKTGSIPNSEKSGLILTSNFIRNGLCHEDRWEVFFNNVVRDGCVYIHWPTVYAWIKDMPFRGEEYWMAREFITAWELDKIRALPPELDKDTELPAIINYKLAINPAPPVVCGTVDEWLQLREHFPIDQLAL
jgi:hypothetical protein